MDASGKSSPRVNPFCDFGLPRQLIIYPTLQSMIDDIINAINELLYRAVEAVESGLLAAPPSSLGFTAVPPAANGSSAVPDQQSGGPNEVLSPEARFEIENGVHQLETLLESAVDRNFDKLEIYLLRGVFTIPPDIVGWVRLAHYEVSPDLLPLSWDHTRSVGRVSYGLLLPYDLLTLVPLVAQNLQFPPPVDAPTQASITLQRRKLRETERLHTALLQEKNRNDALIAQLRRLLPSTSISKPETNSNEPSPFAFLTTHPLASQLSLPTTDDPSSSANPAPNTRSLTTTSQFLTSQVPALRALLASLRPSLQTLADPDHQLPADATAAQRIARTRYIEDRVRRHLERTGRGLDAESEEWTGGGKRVKGREVEGLEGILGSTDESGEGDGDEEEEEVHTNVKEDDEMDA